MKIVPKALEQTADASRGTESWKTQLQNVLAVCLFFGLVYLLLGWVGSFLGARIPDAWERRLAMPVEAVFESSEAGTRVETTLDQLKQGAPDLRELEYRVFSIEMDTANAFAVPGGGIGVTEALLLDVKTDIGLAFVLAHELGHHQHRDITKRLGRGLLLGLVSAVVFNQGGIDPVQAAMQIGETGYSREQEREADRYALELVHRVYGTTEGALEFFELLREEHSENFLQSYFGSHPLTGDRIEALNMLSETLRQVQGSRASIDRPDGPHPPQ